MDSSEPTPLPRHPDDPLGLDEIAVEGAIRLVAEGVARRVVLVGLRRPAALAGIGAAKAQRAGVRFSIDRDAQSGSLAVVVGPLL